MTQPLTLPIPHADLRALVERLWQGERGVARCAGVDPSRVQPRLTGDGFDLGACAFLNWFPTAKDLEDAARAVRSLADALEDAGIVVDREGGVRVVGYAAVEEWRRLDPPRPWPGKTSLVRIVDIPPWEEPRKSYDDAVRRAQQARKAHLAPSCPDVKRDRAAWEAWQRQWGSARRG